MTYVCLLFIVFPAIASVETEDSQEASESTSLLQVGFGLQHQTPQQDSHRRYQVIRSSLDKVSSKVSCSATTTAHEIFQAHDFAGKVAIVTGADRGIGFAIASAFAQRSATVVIATQNRENGELAANSIAVSASNPNVFAIPLDLASFTSIRSFVSTFLDKNVVGGKLDFLVNNADTRATGITEDGFDVEFQAKYLGHFFITELLLPTLRNASSPRVINMASDSANFPCRQLGAPANCLNTFWFLSPKVVQNGSAHSLSEFLLIQHAAELASREGPKVKAFSVAPGPSSQAPEVAAAIIAFCAVASAGQICNGCFLHRNLNLLDSLPFPRPQYAGFVSTFKTQECGVIALAMLASDGFTRDMRSELYERSRVISGLQLLENRPRPTNAIRSPPFRHYLDAHPDVSKVDGDVLVKIWNAEGVGKYNVVWGPPGFSTLEWKAGSVTPYPAEKFWLPSSANFMLLEGSLSYELNGSIKTMSQGDVFWVAAFTRLGPFKPTSGANVTRLAQSGSDWIPSFTTHPKYMYADSIGPWGENWVGDVRFVEYNFSYWKTQMIQHDFEGATVFPPLEDASVRIPHDGLGAPGFTWTEGAEHVVWGHYHQCGTIYVPIVGKFCFGENSQGVILRDACLQPGEARWVRPGYYYDVEFFPGKYVGLTFTRSCGTADTLIFNNESQALSIIGGSQVVFEPEIA